MVITQKKITNKNKATTQGNLNYLQGLTKPKIFADDHVNKCEKFSLLINM
jgi:hypothetical protein